MKVILFIGHHKVGSTALQSFLFRNSFALLKAGILYPSVTPEGLSFELAKARGDHSMAKRAVNALLAKVSVSPLFKTQALPIVPSPNVRYAHNALALKMLSEGGVLQLPTYHSGLPKSRRMLQTISDQVASLSPEVVILASETFSLFGESDPANIRQLAQTFPGADFHVIATLRRVDEYLVAWHAQRLRFGTKVRRLNEGAAEKYFDTVHFDYRLMLEGWLREMPGAKFTIRNYDDVNAAGGSVRDFMEQSGVSFPRGLVPDERQNVSLHRGLIEIARRGNHALDGPAAEELRRYLEELSPQLDLPPSYEVEMLGADLRAEIVDRFEPVHAYLGSVTGKSPFFPTLSEARRTRTFPELDVAGQALSQIRNHPNQPGNASVREFLERLDLSRDPERHAFKL